MTDYRVVFEPAGDGSWSAYSIDLPGVFASGANRSEVEENMRSALTLHLDELRRRGETVPPSDSETAVIAV